MKKIKKDTTDKGIGGFLIKPTVKAGILAVFTIMIGILTSLITNWNSDMFHIVLLIVMLAVCVLYILCMVYYATKETNLHKAYGEIKNQNEAYTQTMANLATTFKVNSSAINLVARYFNGKEKSEHLEWHFDTICQSLCEKIYEMVCKIGEEGDDFSVSYIKRMSDIGDDRITIKMIAYHNDGSVQPHIYERERSVEGNDLFLDLRLFDESNPNPTILVSPEEIIKAKFKYIKEEDRAKYKQYIGIPVFCTGTHMDGLLQVVAMNDSIIKNKKRDLEYFAKKSLIPYANLFLLFSKIDKVILSKNKFMEESHEKAK